MKQPLRRMFALAVVLLMLTELLLSAIWAVEGKTLSALLATDAKSYVASNFRQMGSAYQANSMLGVPTKNACQELRGRFLNVFFVEEQVFSQRFLSELRYYASQPNSRCFSVTGERYTRKWALHQEFSFLKRVYQKANDNTPHMGYALTMDWSILHWQLAWLKRHERLLINCQVEIPSPLNRTLAVWLVQKKYALLLKIKLQPMP